MPWKWYESQVTRIKDESPSTKRFWVKPEEKINFKAGQFVTMDLPIDAKRRQRWRSYSIANQPNDTDLLEFCIVKLEGGLGTEYFFNKVHLGTPIRFKGPSGTFTLPDKIETDLVFICTGTGVAPFRSMLWDIQEHQKEHKNLHLIFGTRYQDGILYHQEFDDLKKLLPRFTYSIALSREENLLMTENTSIRRGYVHQFYLEAYKEVRSDVHFYICGWSNMIDEAVANLLVKMGYDKSQIHYELYG